MSADEDAYPRHDYGPIDTYEVTWKSGHVERVQAHQVQLPSSGLFVGDSAMFGPARPERRVITMHGMFGERWKLVLHAPEDDIVSIRLVTADEPIPGAVQP